MDEQKRTPKDTPEEEKTVKTDSVLGQLKDHHRRAQDLNNPANENESGYYGLAKSDGYADVLKIKFRNRRIFYFHYAYRFNLDLIGNKTLVLIAHSAQLKITFEGRGLEIIADQLLNSKMIWVRESENPLIDDGSTIYIKQISIEGKGIEV